MCVFFCFFVGVCVFVVGVFVCVWGCCCCCVCFVVVVVFFWGGGGGGGGVHGLLFIDSLVVSYLT